MAVKKIGRGVIIAGLIGIVSFFLIAIPLNGLTGIRSVQILGFEISILAILVGGWLIRREIRAESQPGQVRDVVSQRLDVPVLVWAVSGFLFVYMLLFLAPMFLNPGRQMQYFSGYIPNLDPIGNDLRVMVDLLQEWLTNNQSPYTIQFYPPLTYIFFAPLSLIGDGATLYQLFTVLTFFSYCLLTLALPLKLIDKRHLPLALLLFVTGLFSYGFQFELERGQYNVFTFLLCLTSIYIFHYHPKYRLAAYLLFSLSIQLKLYPAIFVVMFVDDWKDWKSVLRRFAGLGLFNLALFFVMGYQIFLDFIRSLTAQVVNPSWIGTWNHSISSFVSVAKQDGFRLVSLDQLRVFRHSAERVEVVFILVFLLLFLCALVIFHLRKERGLDPYLLLTCTIGALILPISYDYTLSILAAPMLLFLAGMAEMKRPWHKLVSNLLTLGMSIAYFSTLTPFNYRPYFLSNTFPLLFLILVLATVLNLMRSVNDKAGPAREPSAS
jgi:hypothetical protein